MEKLGKNLKLFTEKLEMSGGLDIASHLAAARQRAKLSQDDANEHESTGATAA